MMTPTIITVSQLNMYIKSLFDEDMNLSSVFLMGEISNFTNHFRTGHYYFTIKDENASVRAVMFKGANSRLDFIPENGMKVIAIGKVSVFERDGQYQIYVENMQPDGLGSLNLAFEQLKKKLEKEGLFDSKFKKPIPQLPKSVGVVTSETGAAVKDILNVLSRRFPMAEVVLCPVEVQGINAVPSMIDALKRFEKLQCVDVIIIGRGGGSLEELWAFNDEALAREIFNCSIPIISAVGHETDFTISDFVASLRAPTPSAAAELAVPDCRELMEYHLGVKSYIQKLSDDYLEKQKNKIDNFSFLLENSNPIKVLEQQRQIIDLLSTNFNNIISAIIIKRKNEISVLSQKLDALSPLKVLSRGYGMISKDEKIITTVKKVSSGDLMKVDMLDGFFKCEVKEVSAK